MIAIGFIIFWGSIIALLVAEVSRHSRIINYNKAIALKYKAKQETFIKTDNVDGQWLSPVATERAWQEEKLVEIFEHYPTASPRWQYMNGLIQNSLGAKEMYSEQELRNAMNWMLTQYFEFYEWPAMGRVNHYIETIKQQEQ
jgi:hypothetical protein